MEGQNVQYGGEARRRAGMEKPNGSEVG